MKHIVRGALSLCLLLLLLCAFAKGRAVHKMRLAPVNEGRTEAPGGQLEMRDDAGKALGICPLKHTEVQAEISGYVGRIHVRQTFHNPSRQKIEAVYVFPLPNDSAVDDMTLTVGARKIVGIVRPKEEARQIYEKAKQAGHVASLLDQERPNIFTQSVANIEPGAEITVDISYVETLKYEDGVFEWNFPMVVGPRYLGGAALGAGPVADAARISPPITPEGTRTGHDISLTVHIDAGMPLYDVTSTLHDIDVQPDGPTRTTVTLKNENEIPNRDFILHYRLATQQVQEALLTHTDSRGSYFTLVLQPPRRVAPAQAVPKEMVFVIDQTGSQEGWPIEKAKETMRHCIENLNPGDTFQLIGFNTDVYPCFPQAVPANNQTVKQALDYLAPLQGAGGTDILKAADYALKMPTDPDRLRIVCFMTDGYVGDEWEILDYVKKHRGEARMFPFGIGNSVNRFLIDGMAREGGGEPEYVTLQTPGDEAANRFYERVHNPVLTNIQIDWGTLPVADVYPKVIPDLFSAKPIMIHGRLNGPARGTILLHGMMAAGPFTRRMNVEPTDEEDRHEALPSLWARAKVEDLMHQDLRGLENGQFPAEVKKEITDLGVSYRLMTQFTSFVAVDANSVTQGGLATRVDVPVEMASGVSYHGTGAGAGGAYRVSSSQQFSGRAGDPLLTVEAPQNAAQVIALMPGGDVKRLAYDIQSRRWEARFDIPMSAAEGDYAVTVIVVRRDGTRSRLTLHYRVDLTGPLGTGVARIDGGSAPTLHLKLTADAGTARVSALLPWGARIDLHPSDTEKNVFESAIPVPGSAVGATPKVTFVLTDTAHNRTAITVDLSR